MPETNQQDARLRTGFDYYAGLAKDLHDIADRIAALADLAAADQLPPRLYHVFLGVTVSTDAKTADQSTPVVDLFAEIFEATAETEHGRYLSDYVTRATVGTVRVHANTRIPKPAPKRTSAAAKLRAENERLRAELAEAQAQAAQVTATVFPTAAPVRPQPAIDPAQPEAPAAYDQFGVPTGGAQ